MRLDGYNPFNALPERGIRPAAPPASSEQPRPSQAVATRQVSFAAPNAEYIPARRESSEPVHGRANQALASYQSTANLPLDHEAEGIFGIDLYA